MGTESRVQGFWFRGMGSRCWAQSLGVRDSGSGFGFKVLGLGIRVQGMCSKSRVQGFGFRVWVQSLGFRDSGSGFGLKMLGLGIRVRVWVQGLGFRDSGYRSLGCRVQGSGCILG